ncbi:MAG TPA: VWA domain-containing protein [Firmicutes bacterium]|nr:VWA domain-containing protein [Bacillota bacterium]
MKRNLIIVIFLLALTLHAFGNGLIYVPNLGYKNSLYIKEQEVKVQITNNYAQTEIKQIFASRVSSVLEGEYIFPIDEGSEISNFAVWDDGKKIRGVIMEKRRAREIYESLVRRQIDPGLLEHRKENEFSARLAPIPGYGTKRLELEYTQLLKVDSNTIHYRFGLVSEKTSEKIEEISITAIYHSNIPILRIEPEHDEISVKRNDDNSYEITWSGKKIDPDKDFGFYVTFSPEDLGFSFLTHRKTDKEEGYFLLSILPQETIFHQEEKSKRYLLLLDRSASVSEEKAMLSDLVLKILKGLKPEDEFNLLYFHNYPEFYSDSFNRNTSNAREEVREFIDNLDFYGGTNFIKTFEMAFEFVNKQENGNEIDIIFITDGNVSYYEIDYKKISDEIKRINKGNKIFCFGIGNYANRLFLESLAGSTFGAYQSARKFENYEKIIRTFTEKFTLAFLSDIIINWGNHTVFDILPVDKKPVFLKQQQFFVGKYTTPSQGDINITGKVMGNDFKYQFPDISLPAKNEMNGFIPRIWGKERVNYLLLQIKLHGENEEWIREIIEISKKYNFVTPYTSFIAAPRSVLKPRVIRPADPYIFIKTDESIVQVIVKFPFGETKQAEFDNELGLWKVRFIVPKDTPDGEYECTVISTDRFNNQFLDRLKYTIDSKPPTLEVWAKPDKIQRGETVEFFAKASQDTQILYVLTPDKERIPLIWDKDSGYSKGKWKVPEAYTGDLELTVIAIDFAKNKTSVKVKIKIF